MRTREGKVAVRSAACAAVALGLLLAPVPASCADGTAELTAEDCLGTSKRPTPPQWVYGASGPDTCWGAKHDSTSSHLGIFPPPRAPAGNPIRSMSMHCGPRDSHFDDCPWGWYCARTPERDGPHFVVVTFSFDQRRPPAAEPKRTRRRMPRPRRDQEILLRVGLWSKFHAEPPPAAGDAAADAYALRHEAAHYPQAKVGFSGRLSYNLVVGGAPAAGLIRKLHRADNFGWTDDETGQSSYLMTVDEGLREQFGLFMKHCGIDPAPAP